MFEKIERMMLSENPSFIEIYNYLKLLRSKNIPSIVLYNYTYFLYNLHEEKIDEDSEREELFYSTFDILTGYCSNSQSLK